MDIIGFSDSRLFLISLRLKNAWEQMGTTGCDFVPAEVEGASYSLMLFEKKSGGLINLESCNSLETNVPLLELSKVPATDFFYVDKALSILCTERIMKAAVKQKVTNVDFQTYPAIAILRAEETPTCAFRSLLLPLIGVQPSVDCVIELSKLRLQLPADAATGFHRPLS